ncbi:unnamed protein product [Polarella glacialis]|uniref:SET domain-containing protein n=1 Tax=Polarella glacialis TaxID=89957 RepID=A0A813EUB9_POLGL|nr:unnamed protein product [Polarella glacialis]
MDDELLAAISELTGGRVAVQCDPGVGRRLVAAVELSAGEGGALCDAPLVLGSDLGLELGSGRVDTSRLNLTGLSASEVAEFDLVAALARLLAEADSHPSAARQLRLLRSLQQTSCCGSDVTRTTALMTVHAALKAECCVALADLVEAWCFVTGSYRAADGPLILQGSSGLLQQRYAGLFLLSALTEHSCAPNCTCSMRRAAASQGPAQLWIQPLRTILVGEPLSLAYAGLHLLYSPRDFRVQYLAEHPWHIQPCFCHRCAREADRSELAEGIREFVCPACPLRGCLRPARESGIPGPIALECSTCSSCGRREDGGSELSLQCLSDEAAFSARSAADRKIRALPASLGPLHWASVQQALHRFTHGWERLAMAVAASREGAQAGGRRPAPIVVPGPLLDDLEVLLAASRRILLSADETIADLLQRRAAAKFPDSASANAAAEATRTCHGGSAALPWESLAAEGPRACLEQFCPGGDLGGAAWTQEDWAHELLGALLTGFLHGRAQRGSYDFVPDADGPRSTRQLRFRLHSAMGLGALSVIERCSSEAPEATDSSRACLSAVSLPKKMSRFALQRFALKTDRPD